MPVASAPGDPDDPDEIGPFRIVRRLGVGGMGLVFEAIYKKNKRRVALKLLVSELAGEPQLVARFDREMEILKRLKHPNVIRYFGGGVANGRRFYAMEMLTGGSLDDKLKERGALSWEQTLDYSKQIAKALEHAHELGVIHRDLKPANLLLTDKDSLKLSDFGIARDTQRTALTAAGKTVGTMAYMAPEQIHGRDPIGRRTDLYALGCVMFQMLTGHTPFESETQPEMLFKHVEEPPSSVLEQVPDCPPELDGLIQQLLEKKPDDRPFDALAVQVKLDEIRKSAAKGAVAATRRDVTLATGGATMRRDLEKIAVKKKKRKRKRKPDEYVPLTERMAFLVPSLLLSLAAVAWVVWPASESELHEQAAAAMATDDPVAWKDARDRYITTLVAKYPKSDRVEEWNGWLDRIAMNDAEKQAERRRKFGTDPQSEPERLYIEGRQLEEFGDRLTALDYYRGIETVFGDDESARPYVNLARKRAEEIAARVGDSDDTLAFLESQIEKADKLYIAGEKVAAKEQWLSIERLYGGKPEFDVQVGRVRERLNPNQTDQVLRREDDQRRAEADAAREAARMAERDRGDNAGDGLNPTP